MAVTTHTATTSSGGAFTDSIPGEGKFTAVATTILTTPGGTQLTVTSNLVTIAANYDVSIAFVDDGNGIITGALTGEAGTVVSGVTVTLTITDASGNITTAMVTTDSAGSFSYTLTAPGTYTITATATVTTPLGESKNIESDDLDVKYALPDEGEITLSVLVEPWGSVAVISGAVTASEWLSVSGVDVVLIFTDSEGAETTVTAITDESGSYYYEWNFPGVYSVVASCVLSDDLTVTSSSRQVEINSSSAGDHAGDIKYNIDFTSISSLPGAASTYISTGFNDYTRITTRNISYSLSEAGLTVAKSSDGQAATAGVLYFDDISVSDFVATLEMALNTNGVSDSSNVSQNVISGIHFRSASKNIFGWRAGISRYRCGVSQATTASSNSATLVLFDEYLEYGKSLHCRVEAVGTTVRIYINNVLAQTFAREVTNVSGSLGLIYALYDTGRNQNTVFKKLTVYEYI